MKMKVGTRVVFTIFVIIMVIACLFLLGVTFGLINTAMLNGIVQSFVGTDMAIKALYAAIFIVLAVVGICLLFFGVKKAMPSVAKIADFEIGTVTITVRAIEELVEKYVRDFRDVKGLNIRVESFVEAVEIYLQIAVKPETDIPDLTKKLQDGLTDNVQKTTGIKVRKNSIIVMNIDDHLATRVD